MNSGWDEPEKTAEEIGLGNKYLQETNVISIAQLKQNYSAQINTDYRNGTPYKLIDKDLQIKGVVTGNDISGNLYNKISVDDGTGAIIIAIGEGGLRGKFPVGTELLINLRGLSVGSDKGKQATIGTPYFQNYKTNTGDTTQVSFVSRMSLHLWNQHYKIIASGKSVQPIEYNSTWSTASNGLLYGGKLVTIKNVTFRGADGKKKYYDASNKGSVYFTQYGNSIYLYNSQYASFAGNPLPTGTVNVTGIMIRYNNTWELIIRNINDVEEVH
jgi:hypothetical protein